MSSSIISINSEKTMTSREIADLTGKEHRHVFRDAQEMFLALGNGKVGYVQNWTHPQNGQIYKEFVLPKRETLILVSGYSVELRAKIIDRWQELEAKQVLSVSLPHDYLSALKALTVEVEAKQALQFELNAAKPSIEFVEKYADSTGSKGFRQVCKLLHANENAFRAFLQARNIMYRLNGEWTAYRPHIEAGRFDVKVGTSETTSHAFNQCRFTPKGILWVTGEWAKFNLDLGDAA